MDRYKRKKRDSCVYSILWLMAVSVYSSDEKRKETKEETRQQQQQQQQPMYIQLLI